MKRLFTSIFSLLLAGSAGAQVTLDQSSYANVSITSDTFAHIFGAFPVLDTGTNKTWDLSGVDYENVKYYSIQDTGTISAFPGASFWGQRRYNLDTIKFDSKRWSRITANGLERVGEQIERQAIPLYGSGLPNDAPTDSIIVLQQNPSYSSPYPLIKFPASFGSQWTSSYSFIVQMKFTYAADGYVDSAMYYKNTTTYNFRAVGWGKVYVKRFDNSYGEDEVLMVRISGQTTDSFFIGNQPMPNYIAAGLGLQQGSVSNNNFDELFRKNEVTALVLYSYGANNFVNPNYGEVHQLRIPFPSKVESISADKKMILYPNPVNGSELFVKLPSTQSGEYSYKMCRIDGAVVGSGTANAQMGSDLKIALPSTLTTGVYWLSLFHNGKQVNVAPFSYQQ